MCGKGQTKMIKILDRANRLKREINLIGGAHSEMSPLARVMGSKD